VGKTLKQISLTVFCDHLRLQYRKFLYGEDL